MKVVEINADIVPEFAAASAKMFAAVRAAQDLDTQVGLTMALAEGAELVLEVWAQNGTFTAWIQTRSGERAPIFEAVLRVGTMLDSSGPSEGGDDE